jgi:hypothetical protein
VKVVFDNLATFLSISPNQTPIFAVCLPGPSWTFLPFLFLLILYSLPYMYTLYNVHVLTPTCTVQYVISCAVNIWLQLYTCFLNMRSKHASSEILNDIGRNSLLGNRKKIAKFLMRTFTCRSTFLYALLEAPLSPLLCPSLHYPINLSQIGGGWGERGGMDTFKRPPVDKGVRPPLPKNGRNTLLCMPQILYILL